MFRPAHCFIFFVLRKGKKKTSFLFSFSLQHYDSGTLGFRNLYQYDRRKSDFCVCVVLEIPNEIEHFFMFIGHLYLFFHAFSILSMSSVHFYFGYFFSY